MLFKQAWPCLWVLVRLGTIVQEEPNKPDQQMEKQEASAHQGRTAVSLGGGSGFYVSVHKFPTKFHNLMTIAYSSPDH